jgi:hypothetical protein
MLAPLVFVDQKQLSEPGAGGPERAKGFARPEGPDNPMAARRSRGTISMPEMQKLHAKC